MAYLASLPKAPNNYNPKTKYFQAIDRRNWVLDRMLENDFIKTEDLIFHQKKKLIVENRYENKFEEAKYFKEEVRKQLNNLYLQALNQNMNPWSNSNLLPEEELEILKKK